MTPTRIQLRRTAGWRKPDDAVVVARPGVWGNPISAAEVSEQYPRLDRVQVARLIVHDFELLVSRGTLGYPDWRFAGGRRGPVSWTYPAIAEIRARLHGHDLACWCPLDQPCHADVLLAVANPGLVRTSPAHDPDGSSDAAPVETQEQAR